VEEIMANIQQLTDQLSLPVLASPLFTISNPDLVIAQCLNGIVGSFPALNARPKEDLDRWLTSIETALAEARAADPDRKIAPYAVNQIAHRNNDRLEHDLDVCARHKVPVIITSLRAPEDLVRCVHAYRGLVFHDVTTIRHAEKALEAGVDGLILVCAGAGGHAGRLNPFALLGEVRRFYDGPLVLAGAITNGASILAAQAMGADLAYMGTRFIATTESRAAEGYKSMIVDSRASDIIYTPFFTGIPGNYLRPSINAAGLDPDNLRQAAGEQMAYLASDRVKPWKNIWGAGQGVGQIDLVQSTAEVIDMLKAEYMQARQRLKISADGSYGRA
jgi:nitronate monooxygenase